MGTGSMMIHWWVLFLAAQRPRTRKAGADRRTVNAPAPYLELSGTLNRYFNGLG